MGKPPVPGTNAPPVDDSDQLLDEALDESFPASDPVAIHIDTEAEDADASSKLRERDDVSVPKR